MCVIELERCDLWNEVARTARKPRRCSCCRVGIQAGERYTAHFSVLDGEAQSESLCEWCRNSRAEFVAAHGGEMIPNPSAFRIVLEDCIHDGDPESERAWKPMLTALLARVTPR